MTGPRPLHTSDEAVRHALAMVGRGMYRLGTGNLGSNNDDERDCFGFAVCENYGIRRHRPGFNAGPWATVSDDLNCNSAIEDAEHEQELFERIYTPFPGALIMYPTIDKRIGHVKIVVGISRTASWDTLKPDWSLLDTVECRGPNGKRPGIVAGTGAGMPAMTVMLRVKP